MLDLLRASDERLFALVDGGRDPDVLTTVYRHDAPARSLYQGPSEATLGPSGPFLVELGQPPEHEELLRELVRKGLGRSWGIYATSRASFDEVRHHFRTLLMVRRQRDQSELYFRFYDPRVLAVFLPTCDRGQLAQMFGPVDRYLLESQDGQAVLRFSLDGGDLVSDRLARYAHGSAAHA